MIHPVVQQMAALTKRAQIAQPVAGGIMIQMGRCQNHLRLSYLQMLDQVRRRDPPAPAIEPVPRLRMLPPATRQHLKVMSMRPTAALTETPCPLEPHLSAQLGPVRGVKRLQFRSDRHSVFVSTFSLARGQRLRQVLDFLTLPYVGSSGRHGRLKAGAAELDGRTFLSPKAAHDTGTDSLLRVDMGALRHRAARVLQQKSTAAR